MAKTRATLVREVLDCAPDGKSVSNNEWREVEIDWLGELPANTGSYVLYDSWRVSWPMQPPLEPTE